MVSRPDSWATQQLVEFLASVSSYASERSAVLGGIEAVAAALESEVAAMLAGDQVVAAIGYPRRALPEAEMVEAAAQATGTLAVEGVGECRSAAVAVDEEGGRLLVARHASEPLTDEEHDLLRGMGRVLGMALEGIRLLASLHERQALLEKLSRVQQSIARRTDLQEVLDSIATGASELLGEEVAGLRLVSESDPSVLELVSAVGMTDELVERVRTASIDLGAAGLAVKEDRLIALEDYAEFPGALPDLAADGLTATMAAPIHERGEVVGCLAVGTRRPDRSYSDSEREALIAFAEHAGLALNDTHTVAETVHQAFHDSLTGLPNRAQFLDQLEHAVARTQRDPAGVTILFADLDGFKTVNDSLGHAAGDELLVLVAERLQRGLRPGDIAARFGGDEFAVLLEGLSGAAALAVAERILRLFEDPFQVRDRQLYVTLSIGVAQGRNEPDQLLRNADLAMYQAKSQGKGRATAFEPGMHAAVVERLELEVDLRQAIAREELVLHYQPVCKLDTGEVVGVEALVRWMHPVKGLVQPNDFIPMAEESRQIMALGRWVLDEACRQAAVWRARSPRPQRFEVSVNLSGVQLGEPDLVDQVRVALGRAGLEPESLILEITETALMADTVASARTLQSLKELGVQLAVDDFGTGYSSLEYLQRFPIDVLKVAKSFVDGLDPVGEGTALVQAVIDLAKGFGLRVVAEGVEEAGQRRHLIELGCELGQGFLFARPADAAAIGSLLAPSAALGGGIPSLPELSRD